MDELVLEPDWTLSISENNLLPLPVIEPRFVGCTAPSLVTVLTIRVLPRIGDCSVFWMFVTQQDRHGASKARHVNVPHYWIYWIVCVLFPPFILIFSAHPFHPWTLVSILLVYNSWLLSWRGVSHTKFLLLLFFLLHKASDGMRVS